MRPERVILHWNAGGNMPTALDFKHYHFVIDKDGKVHKGLHPISANMPVKNGQLYAAHTKGLNTGSVGVAVLGMLNAVEKPFNTGPKPINQLQIDTLIKFVAELCIRYDIPVTPKTVLSHAEVEPTLGVKQNGKWDIAWLPGMPGTGNPVVVGDLLRVRVRSEIKRKTNKTELQPAVNPVKAPPKGNQITTSSTPLPKPAMSFWQRLFGNRVDNRVDPKLGLIATSLTQNKTHEEKRTTPMLELLEGKKTYIVAFITLLIALAEGVLGVDIPGADMSENWVEGVLVALGMGSVRNAIK